MKIKRKVSFQIKAEVVILQCLSRYLEDSYIIEEDVFFWEEDYGLRTPCLFDIMVWQEGSNIQFS